MRRGNMLASYFCRGKSAYFLGAADSETLHVIPVVNDLD